MKEKERNNNNKKRNNKDKGKEEEEEKSDKTKLSMLGRSVFVPTFQEMSKLRREIVQNHEKRGYSYSNINQTK